MFNKNLKSTVAGIYLALLLLPAGANAALIDSGGFFTDTAGQLDWLDITATTNRSYNDVVNELGTTGEFAGWRYATGAEFEGLLLGQGWTAMTCTDVLFCGWSVSNNSKAAQLVSLFGDAYELNADGVDTAEFIGGLKGMTADTTPGCDGTCTRQWVAELRDQGFANPDDLLNSPLADWASTQSESVGRNSLAAGRGSFLVRDSTVVPIPASVVLFGSALFGLAGWSRRRKAG